MEWHRYRVIPLIGLDTDEISPTPLTSITMAPTAQLPRGGLELLRSTHPLPVAQGRLQASTLGRPPLLKTRHSPMPMCPPAHGHPSISRTKNPLCGLILVQAQVALPGG